MNILIFSIIFFGVSYSGYVQVKLIRLKTYTQKQKLLQSLIIWLIPFFGAWIIDFTTRQLNINYNKEESWKRLVKYDENNEA